MSKNGVYQGFSRTKANKMRQIRTILALYLLFLMLTVFLCNQMCHQSPGVLQVFQIFSAAITRIVLIFAAM